MTLETNSWWVCFLIPLWNVLPRSQRDCCRDGNHWEHSPKLRRSDKLLAPKRTDTLLRLSERSPPRAGCFTVPSFPLSVEAPLAHNSQEEGSPASPHVCVCLTAGSSAMSAVLDTKRCRARRGVLQVGNLARRCWDGEGGREGGAPT